MSRDLKRLLAITAVLTVVMLFLYHGPIRIHPMDDFPVMNGG